MAGHGTGYPIAFVCSVARRNCTGIPKGHVRIVRTGRTRLAPGHGKGHTGKLDQSHGHLVPGKPRLPPCGHPESGDR